SCSLRFAPYDGQSEALAKARELPVVAKSANCTRSSRLHEVRGQKMSEQVGCVRAGRHSADGSPVHEALVVRRARGVLAKLPDRGLEVGEAGRRLVLAEAAVARSPFAEDPWRSAAPAKEIEHLLLGFLLLHDLAGDGLRGDEAARRETGD